MTLTLLATLLVQTQTSSEAVPIRRFLQVANLQATVSAKRSAGPDPQIEFNGSVGKDNTYTVDGAIIWVNRETGLIDRFSGKGNHAIDRMNRPQTDERGRPGLYPVPRKISDDEAQAIARRIIDASGRKYVVKIGSIRDRSGSNGDCLTIQYTPTFHDVPYGDPYGFVAIDRETGELDSLHIDREPPVPPQSVVPQITLEVAHLIALQAAATVSGVPVANLKRPRAELNIETLRSWPFSDAPAAVFFNATDQADFRANRARLVYDVRLRDARYDFDAYGLAPVVFTVIIDAFDGRVLKVVKGDYPTLSIGKPKAPVVLVPPATALSWRVAEGKAPWGKPVISTLTPTPAEGFHAGRKLLLTDGKLAFTASYDPATGLLGVERGKEGGFDAYRPGPALAALLKARSADASSAGGTRTPRPSGDR